MVEAKVTLDCKTSISAPPIGEPLPSCETAPPKLPVPTLKVTELLVRLPIVTTTAPVVAPSGTGTTILDGPQLVGIAPTPPNVIELDLWLSPKLAPVIVTTVPAIPELGDNAVIVGPTENCEPKLDTLPTVTTTDPVVAPAGTGTTMEELPQLVGAASTPLNVTMLVPCVEPNADPLMVTGVPGPPDVGLSPVIPGERVKLMLLLATPFTVTTRGPEVALAGTGAWMAYACQLLGVAVTPLNLTVLVPWLAPNTLPRIVTLAPIVAEGGLISIIEGSTV